MTIGIRRWTVMLKRIILNSVPTGTHTFAFGFAVLKRQVFFNRNMAEATNQIAV
jgi:hypothetical protein